MILKDVIALIAYITAAEKWAKLVADHVSITASKGINANQKFQSFAFIPGETVYEIRQRFDCLVTECALQGFFLTEMQKTTVLLTHPTEKWKTFIDSISLQAPLPTTATILQQMIILAEKWEARDEKEHTEANFADSKRQTRTSPGGQRREQGQQHQQREALQPGSANPCSCCGSILHLFATCPKKDLSCNDCHKKGHLLYMCNFGGEQHSATTNKATIDQPSSSGDRPKKVAFTGVAKKASALKNSHEAMAAEIIDLEAEENCNVSRHEWLAESGSSKHMCNELRMLWDVRQLKNPIIVRQLVGEVRVTQIGTAKVECENETGAAVKIDLLDTLLVPDLSVNIFSLQKMRQAYIRLEYPEGLGTVWMVKKSGETIGSLDESAAGRPTLNCHTFLRELDDYPLLSFVVNSGSGAPAVVAEPDATTGGTTMSSPVVASALFAAVAKAAAATAAVAPGPFQEEPRSPTTIISSGDERMGHVWWRNNEEMWARWGSDDEVWAAMEDDSDFDFSILLPATVDEVIPLLPHLPLPSPPPLASLLSSPIVAELQAADDDIPLLIEDDSDDEGVFIKDITPPSSPRRSKRLKRGIPAIRYDDIYDLNIGLTLHESMNETLGYGQTEQWIASLDLMLDSLFISGECSFGAGDSLVLLSLYLDDVFEAWNQRESLKLVNMHLLNRFRMKNRIGMLSG